jgi:Ca2+-transporting ATPase
VLAVGGLIPAGQFDPAGDLLPWVEGITLHALVGIIDPPRAEAREAIARCHAAGIEVKMITGDHRVTAAPSRGSSASPARPTRAASSTALPPPRSPRWWRRAPSSPASPEHKLRIVEPCRAAATWWR